MANYRYLFYDLLTNTPLTEFPMRRVEFSKKINDVGTFKGYTKLSDPNVEPLLGAWENTPPGRTSLYVDRDGSLVWGGIVTTRRYSQGTVAGGAGQFTLEIGAQEFMWYFRNKRVITADAIFTNVDQLTLAQSLINTAQGVASGNIGVAVPSNTSGILRTQTWHGFERKKVGQALMDMAVLDQGFDWSIDVDYGIGGQAPGVPGKQLALGYPRLGVPFSTSGWMFEFPGNIVDYVWPEDASLQAVTAYMQGAGSGPNMVQSSNTITSLLDAGYPLLEEVFRAKDQTDPNALGARAVAYAKAYSSPVILPVLTLRADIDPVLGSYRKGDDVNVRITSPQFRVSGGAPGIDQFWRITEVKVQPQDEQGQPERVYLSLGGLPS